MGIKGLESLILTNNDNDDNTNLSVVKKKLIFLKNKKVVIDISPYLYAGKKKNDIIGCMFNLITKLLKNNIYPLFVFDGNFSIEKEREQERRKQQKNKAQINNIVASELIDEINSKIKGNQINESIISKEIDDLKQYAEKCRVKSLKLDKGNILQVKKLLSLFGIPFIHLNLEADIVCASLVKCGIVDYCLSSDKDLLPFGCPNLVQLDFIKEDINIYNLNNILTNFELSYEEFIDLCILLGSDYTPRIIGLKKEYALELIKKYKNLESISKNINEISDDFESKTGKYLRLPVNFNFEDTRKLFMTSYDKEFLLKHIGYIDFKRIKNVLLRYETDFEPFENMINFLYLECKSLKNNLVNSKLKTIFKSNYIKLNLLNNNILYHQCNNYIEQKNNQCKYYKHKQSNHKNNSNYSNEIREDIKDKNQKTEIRKRIINNFNILTVQDIPDVLDISNLQDVSDVSVKSNNKIIYNLRNNNM